MRALIVDDSKPVRGILAKMLRELGFDTHEAGDGQEALAAIDEAQPDIAIVNWHMPVMDGLAFTRALRQHDQFSKLTLLFVSSEASQPRIDDALAAGVDAYLTKPFTKASLSEKLTGLGFTCRTPERPTITSKKEPGSTGGPVAGQSPVGESSEVPLRVLVVDDAAVIRSIVSRTLERDPEIAVAGTAADGHIALEKINQLNPDLVLLDIEMPKLDGYGTLKALRKTHPHLPVVMFSSLTERGAKATMEALILGANDYVPKPRGSDPADVARVIRDQIIPRLKQFATGVRRGDTTVAPAPAAKTLVGQVHSHRIDIVVIAVSTGGPNALTQLLPTILPSCPVPVVIVQHMLPMFTQHLANSLSTACDRRIEVGADGVCTEAGAVWLAPGDQHVLFQRRDGRVQLALNQEPPENACRPSADVLFRSAAEVYGKAVLGIVLTGMGQDGFLGCERIVEAGGEVLAQDETTSVVWGMPGAVARAGLASAVLPLPRLGMEILLRLRRGRRKASE